MLENKTIFFKRMTIHMFMRTQIFSVKSTSAICRPSFSLRNSMCVIWINKFIKWEGFPNRTITEPRDIKMMLNQA